MTYPKFPSPKTSTQEDIIIIFFFFKSSTHALSHYTVFLKLRPLFQEYEETCLFTIARFSASESLRVYPNIYKNSPPFASREGFPLVGIAMSVRERESASDSIILSLLA